MSKYEILCIIIFLIIGIGIAMAFHLDGIAIGIVIGELLMLGGYSVGNHLED